MSAILLKAAELTRAGTPFVMATVVRAQAPTSAKPGDKALITEDGLVAGWVGGSCSEPTVRRFAREALEDGVSRLVQISPEAEPASRAGLTVVPMTCFSGGALEIYLEPFIPALRIVVYGNSPTAQAVDRLAAAMGYVCTVVDLTDRPAMEKLSSPVVRSLDELALPRTAAAVVASHGLFDDEAATHALALNLPYVGVVASKRRFAQLQQRLRAQGATDAQLARLKGPAGLDIGARNATEVALSILAELIQWRRDESVEASTTVAVEAPKKSCCAS